MKEDSVFFEATPDAVGVADDSRLQSPDNVLSVGQEPYIMSIQGGVEDGFPMLDTVLEPLFEGFTASAFADDSKNTEETLMSLEELLDVSTETKTSDRMDSWMDVLGEEAPSPPSIVPDMDTEMPTDTRFAGEIEQFKVPQTKTRRPKVLTPTEKRTKAWMLKRERNNKAAKANRDKEKAAKLAAKQRHKNLLIRNRSMREDVAKLDAERARLVQLRDARRASFNQPMCVPDILADILEDLTAEQFSLSPPDPML